MMEFGKVHFLFWLCTYKRSKKLSILRLCEEYTRDISICQIFLCIFFLYSLLYERCLSNIEIPISLFKHRELPIAKVLFNYSYLSSCYFWEFYIENVLCLVYWGHRYFLIGVNGILFSTRRSWYLLYISRSSGCFILETCLAYISNASAVHAPYLSSILRQNITCSHQCQLLHARHWTAQFSSENLVFMCWRTWKCQLSYSS